jgi:hypothetical protein
MEPNNFEPPNSPEQRVSFGPSFGSTLSPLQSSLLVVVLLSLGVLVIAWIAVPDGHTDEPQPVLTPSSWTAEPMPPAPPVEPFSAPTPLPQLPALDTQTAVPPAAAAPRNGATTATPGTRYSVPSSPDPVEDVASPARPLPESVRAVPDQDDRTQPALPFKTTQAVPDQNVGVRQKPGMPGTRLDDVPHTALEPDQVQQPAQTAPREEAARSVARSMCARWGIPQSTCEDRFAGSRPVARHAP